MNNFQREYKNLDGTIDIWKYDISKNPTGPYEVEVIYPKSFKSPSELLDKENDKLPLTKRKYINPVNGKLVSYQRAKMLNII